MQNSQQKKLGLSLRGGLARCAGYFGVLKAFDEEGVQVDMLCGSSMGAIIAAVYASDLDNNAVVELGKHLSLRKLITWESIKDEAIMGRSDFINRMKEVFGERRLEDLRTPLWVQVTNLETLELEYLDKGYLYNVLAATSAFPVLTAPFEIDGKKYIDGDVTAGYGADFLRNKGAEVVIGLTPGVLERPRDGEFLPTRVMDALTISINRIKMLDQKIAPVDLLIDNLGPDTGAFDFHKMDELVNLGYNMAMSMMSQIKEALQVS